MGWMSWMEMEMEGITTCSAPFASCPPKTCYINGPSAERIADPHAAGPPPAPYRLITPNNIFETLSKPGRSCDDKVLLLTSSSKIGIKNHSYL